MKSRAYLLLAVILITSAAHAQNTDRLIPRVLPPAPEAASLGKYGDFPVSTYTGLPNISIPLYQIESRDASLPITLSYHAAGAQVKEEASWVGLGWTLNAGGAVTRNIRGHDDFKEPYGFWFHRTNMPQEPASNPLQAPHMWLKFDQNDNFNVNLPDENGVTKNYYGDLTDEHRDWASDIYYFNCGNLSGKFLIDRTGELRLLDHGDKKLELSGDLASWKITDADGTQYFFGDADYQGTIFNPSGNQYYQLSSSRSTEPNVNGYSTAFNNIRNGQDLSITSWFIKKIVSPSGETISFEYDKPGYNSAPNTLDDIIAPLPDYSNYMAEGSGTFCENIPPGGRISLSFNVHQAVYLRKINFTNGYLRFDRDPTKRQDLSGANRLSSIKIYQRQIGTVAERLIRTFDLTHNYFVTTTDGLFDYSNLFTGLGGYVSDVVSCNTKRLRLDAVTETHGGESKTWSLTYSDVQLPKKTSYAVDHWGYFNGQNNPHLVPEVVWGPYTIYRQEPNSSPTEIIVPGQTYAGANRNPNIAFAVAGSLKKITYPTKGYTEYVMESNTYVENSVTKAGGGLRVARIDTRDTEAQQTMSDYFTYEGGVLVTPVQYFMLKYCSYGHLLSGGNLLHPMPSTTGFVTYLSPFLYRYSSVVYPMSNSAAGSPIGYSKVERSQVGVGTNATNGKTVYEFHNQPDVVIPPDKDGFVRWPGVPGISDTQNGNLLYQTDYARDATQPTGFRKVKQVKNNYVALASAFANKSKFYWNRFVHIQNNPPSASVGMWTYPVPTTWNHLTSSEESIFNTNLNEVKVITRYGFHEAAPASTAHHQLLSKSITGSDAKVNNTLYRYPADYNNAAMGGVIQTLKTKNILSPIIEERVVDSETTPANTLSATVTTYSTKGKPLLLYLAENTAPVAGVATNPSNVISDANLYKQRIDISYNNNSNILNTRKTGYTPTTYIWGYKNTLPIAEIINAEQYLPPAPTITPKTVSAGTTGEGMMDYQSMGTFSIDHSQTIDFTRTLTVTAGTMSEFTIMVKFEAPGVYVSEFTMNPNFQLVLPAGNYTVSHLSSIVWAGGPGSGDVNIRLDFDIANQGATPVNVFHTSFEEATTGVSTTEYRTGAQSLVGSYLLKRPTNNGDYVVSYWTKPIGSGNWSLVRNVVTFNSGSTDMTIGSAGNLIDEVRLYPVTAQMTTYTYDPLIGVTSQTNPADIVAFYVYDGLGRLKSLLDNDRKIVKHYDYHYKE